MAGKGAPEGPSGGEVLKRFLADLSKGWPEGLTVLTGDDLFHLDAAQKALLRSLAPEEEGTGGLALSVIGDRDAPISAVVAAACSVGMFSPRRVVLVRDVEALSGESGALAEYAKAPPRGSFLIVRAPKLDARRKIQKELLESGRVRVFRTPTPKESAAEVVELARARGFVLDREALECLVQVSAGDLNRLSNELDKIRDWRGQEGRGPVSLHEAREVAVGDGAVTGWELANAVLARDAGLALEAGRRLADAGEPPLKTLGGLAWRSRAMLQVKAAIVTGARPEDAARSVWAGVPADRLLSGLERWPLGDLLALPSKMLRADRTLKSRQIAGRVVLESLAEELTAGKGRVPGERR
jgi:DNA polymerase-3 subunit delta